MCVLGGELVHRWGCLVSRRAAPVLVDDRLFNGSRWCVVKAPQCLSSKSGPGLQTAEAKTLLIWHHDRGPSPLPALDQQLKTQQRNMSRLPLTHICNVVKAYRPPPHDYLTIKNSQYEHNIVQVVK